MDPEIDQTQARVLNNLDELKRENLRLTREIRKLQMLHKPVMREDENYEAVMLAEAQAANLEKERVIEDLRVRIDLVTADNKRLALAGTLGAERSTSSDKYSERRLAELEGMIRERHEVVDQMKDAHDLIKSELSASRQDLTAALAKVKTLEMTASDVQAKSGELFKKFKIAENTSQQLIGFLGKCEVLSFVKSADFERCLGGVSPLGFFILDEGSREIIKTYKPTEYKIGNTGNGFVLKRLDGFNLEISFPGVTETRARAVFWIECLRAVGFK